MTVDICSDGERSTYAAKDFNPGDYVSEYAASVRPTDEEARKERDDQHRSNEMGCYMLEARFEGQEYLYDATLHLKDPGRYINHTSKGANLVLMNPVMIGGNKKRLRIGFVAKQMIKRGDELFYDYGVRDKEIPWLTSSRGQPQVASRSAATAISRSPSPSYPTKASAKPKRTVRDCPIQVFG